MFGTIRRHQQWLWVVISTLTIISFVYYFGPDAKFGRRAEFNVGTIDGRRVTQDEFLKARDEVMLEVFLTRGRWPERSDDKQLEPAVRQRLFFLAKMKESNIQVSDEAAVQVIGQFFRSSKTGKFDTETYNNVVSKRLPEARMTEDDLIRYFRNEVGRNQLMAVLGLSGRLVPPRVAEAYYQRENEQFSGAVALLSYSNFLSKVKVDAASISNYFAANQSGYRTRTNVQVSYVGFYATNYYPEAEILLSRETNLDMAITQRYVELGGTNHFKGMTPEAGRASVREEFRHRMARGVAHSNFVQFANAVYPYFEKNANATNLAYVAGLKGLTAKDTAPFTDEEEKGLAGFPAGDSERIRQGAFQLSMEQPIAPETMTTNGSYLVVLKSIVPSRLQTFEEVKSRVSDDYRESEATDKLMEAGSSLQKKLSEGLTQGKTFKALCDEAGVKAIELPFLSAQSRTNVPELDKQLPAGQLVRVAGSVSTGQASRFIPLQNGKEGGFVLYVKERKPAEPAVVQVALPLFSGSLREQRESAVVNDWFSKEFEKSWKGPVVAVDPEAEAEAAAKKAKAK